MKSLIDKYTVKGKTKRIERREFVGVMNDSACIFDQLRFSGWRIIYSGPYCNKRMWPKLDATRFHIIAEREIQ